MIELELLGVRVELPSNTPVMLLQEREGRRRNLSIFIGGPEAAAIAFALDGVEPPRPLTHDLACTVIEELGSSLTRVVITELRDTTFFAELHLSPRARLDQSAAGDPVDADAGVSSGPTDTDDDADADTGDDGGSIAVISARPSDAVALAVRVGAPIFTTSELLDEVGFTDAEDEEEDAEEVVEEFREFIQNVTPDDFAS